MYTLPVLLSTAPSVYSANNKYQTHNLWSVATVLTPTTGHYICNRNKNVCICVDLQTSMLNAAIVIACLHYLWPCCTDSKAHSTDCTLYCTLYINRCATGQCTVLYVYCYYCYCDQYSVCRTSGTVALTVRSTVQTVHRTLNGQCCVENRRRFVC